MGCLGVHFALDAKQVAALKAIDEDERVEFVQEDIEGEFWQQNKSRGQETDKAWDAIHRSLTDGKLEWENGEYPLNLVILGGESLYGGDDYIMSLKSPEQVRDIAAALARITETQVRTGYDKIDPEEYGMELSTDDFEYTWSSLKDLIEFYRRAASAGHAVLFTADQ